MNGNGKCKLPSMSLSIGLRIIHYKNMEMVKFSIKNHLQMCSYNLQRDTFVKRHIIPKKKIACALNEQNNLRK
jgi:hypothetical protein